MNYVRFGKACETPYAGRICKGASAEEIAKVVRDLFNSIDLSGDRFDAVAIRATRNHE
ncbi:hypothetical protein GR250_09970 [Rhizobium leguminosarum]|nr:hypothetical protein [Rhizobium leguminosarum]